MNYDTDQQSVISPFDTVRRLHIFEKPFIHFSFIVKNMKNASIRMHINGCYFFMLDQKNTVQWQKRKNAGGSRKTQR